MSEKVKEVHARHKLYPLHETGIELTMASEFLLLVKMEALHMLIPLILLIPHPHFTDVEAEADRP